MAYSPIAFIRQCKCVHITFEEKRANQERNNLMETTLLQLQLKPREN